MVIYDLSHFKKIFDDCRFQMPIRWDGKDFYETLKAHFDLYCNAVNDYSIRPICDGILNAVKAYLCGFPAEAYNILSNTMDILFACPLKIYTKTGELGSDYDPLKLFRIVRVTEKYSFGRDRVFHTPYDLRSKIGTNRYSIAGYPCLYLATTLDLCKQETGYKSTKNLLTSRFQVQRVGSDVKIELLELGIKPHDFYDDRDDIYEYRGENSNKNYFRRRKLPSYLLQSNSVIEAYVLWYPLISACSFIRLSKCDPFAPEYIIPQLLMQWIRQYNKNSVETASPSVLGIRYFSCASFNASEIGFNYVFPTSGETENKYNKYCSLLSRSFKLTSPIYIEDFPTVENCERSMVADTNIDFI